MLRFLIEELVAFLMTIYHRITQQIWGNTVLNIFCHPQDDVTPNTANLVANSVDPAQIPEEDATGVTPKESVKKAMEDPVQHHVEGPVADPAGDHNSVENRFENTLTTSTPKHPLTTGVEPSNYLNAAYNLLKKCKAAGNISSLETAISLLQYAAHSFSTTDPRIKECENHLASALLTRFCCTGDTDDVYKALFLCANALGRPVGTVLHEVEFGDAVEDAPDDMMTFALDVLHRFHQAVELATLENAIFLYHEALSLQDALNPLKWRCLLELSEALLMGFRYTGDIAKVDAAVACMRQGIRMKPNLSVYFAAALVARAQAPATMERTMETDQRAIQLAEDGRNSHKVFQESRDIDTGIGNLREATSLLSWGHDAQGSVQAELARMLQTRYNQRGNFTDLKEAIGLYRGALTLLPAPHPNRGKSLNNFAAALKAQYEQKGDLSVLEEAINLHREVLALRPAPHPDRGTSLNNLAIAIQRRYEQKGDFKDLEEAVELHKEVLALRPSPHPDRGMSLINFGTAFQSRYEQKGAFEDLEVTIELLREALVLHPAPHPLRGMSLNNLAGAVQTRYAEKANFKDLEEAIELHREALALRPASHPDRGMSLINFGAAIRTRFEQKGDIEDLEEAIEIYREALALHPTSHLHHNLCLNHLAGAIQTRYKQTGDLKDLEQAIELHRKVLALQPTLHPDRSMSLNNLAAAVQTRYEQKGDLNDLEEAIELHREALILYPTSHPRRGSSLNNLAGALQTRYRQKGDFNDLEEAIELHREAISLRPTPHPDHGKFLSNLASAIQTRYEEKGDFQDINEAIELHRGALALHPTPHPYHETCLYNLASALRSWSEQKGDIKDLEEAIGLCERGIVICAAPHPNRGGNLTLLACLLANKYERTLLDDDLNASISAFQEASIYLSSPPLKRLHHTHAWALIASQRGHDSALSAYRATIDLLPQIAALHLDAVSRRNILATLQGSQLASGAAACALSQAEYDIAVELLEASRSIFWSQALRLRTPLHELEATSPDLALKLRELAKELERESFRDTSRNLRTDSQDKVIAMEAVGARLRQLNEEWDATINSVRLLPGFEHIMRPKGITTLRQAAKSGPIVLLIGNRKSCSALVVTSTANVQHIPLPEMSLPKAIIYGQLTRALAEAGFDITNFECPGALKKDDLEWSDFKARLDGEREGEIKMSTDAVFHFLLADLWEAIVKPVFEAMKIRVTQSAPAAYMSLTNLQQSDNPRRLWWCPTGAFTFLPIHAAGIYTDDSTDCVADYVVSSYTPTISALLDPPIHPAGQFKMTTVIQPYAPGCSPLPGCWSELHNIAARVPSPWLTILGDTGQATITTALLHLRESSIVHFACHGIQDLTQPLDSGLILSDGRLKVSEIMRGPATDGLKEIKRTMSLAYLSACETAKGDKDSPDESMHLAATLLFAGFRSVVATMWTMQDEDGPKIADKVYEHLFRDCDPNSNPRNLPDLTKSADALHYAVSELRKEPRISFKRWVPFVHYGL
ncbi:CHAT domain-containing protein [Mycena pura]|uniref:CHAT domain-containing protein n=1 Tax=Mycena pura TaxID=153505 RepID=A0AAD6VHY6_9AGAR|nr:CHAT domain-containing protein [Mycena pura]